VTKIYVDLCFNDNTGESEYGTKVYGETVKSSV